MHNKTVAGPFAFASPFGGIDPSKGPLATSGRALALKLAVERAPLSWQGDELFKLADKFVEYISGERAEEDAPAPAPATLPPDLAAERAAYEVRDPATGHAWVRIYASGRAEGLPLGCTINRIPELTAKARAEGSASRAPVGGLQGQFFRDPQGCMWAWDDYNALYRGVVYK